MQQEFEKLFLHIQEMLIGLEGVMKEEEVKRGVHSAIELNDKMAEIVERKDLNVIEVTYASLYVNLIMLQVLIGEVKTEEMIQVEKELNEYIKNYEEQNNKEEM